MIADGRRTRPMPGRGPWRDRPLIPDGDRLLAQLAALANPHRLRIVAVLQTGGRKYVSQLARELQISRPLLHLHLQKLQEAGLVGSQLELSADGNALNYFQVVNFDLRIDPAAISQAIKSLSQPDPSQS